MTTEIPKTAERSVSLRFTRGDDGIFNGVSFSSNIALERFWGTEVLVHDEAAVDLRRAADGGLPLLINHDMDQFIGRVENIRLDGDKLRGDFRFDEQDERAIAWRDKYESGIARDVSVRYSVGEVQETGNEILITRWEPLEVSAVSVPADPTVGIGRSGKSTKEGKEVNTDKDPGAQAGTGGGGVEVANYRGAVDLGRAQGAQEADQAQQQRIAEIVELFSHPRYQAPRFQQLKDACLASNATVVQAQRELLEEINRDPADPVAPSPTTDRRDVVRATPGDDNMDKWMAGVQQAMEFRTGLIAGKEARELMAQNPFGGLRLLEIARDYLRQLGVNAGALPPMRASLMALQRSGVISHSTSDFSTVLANVAEKQLTLGYTKTPETWRPFCRVIPLSDFKQASLVNLTAFTALATVAENAEYQEGQYGEVGENIQLATYGRLFNLSRQAILNDDVNAFGQIPRGMGAAAARVVGNLVYNTILLGNPTMSQDSTSLFHADHGNLVAAGSGAAPSVATLDTAIAAMGVQKDPDDRETLNIRPSYLIVPKALEGTSRLLTSSMSVQDMNPGVTNATTVTNADNRFSDLTVISEARIDSNDAAKWFLAADPNEGVIDTISVGFLDGMEEPYMEQQEGFTTDGVRFKVRLDAAAVAVAYQGLYFNDGN